MGFPIELKREQNFALLMEMYEELKKVVENSQDYDSIGRETVYWIKWFEEHKM